MAKRYRMIPGALTLAGAASLSVMAASADAANADNNVPAVQTNLGTGPYPAVMEVSAVLPGYVIYRPEELAEAPKLGVMVWGNGGCSGNGGSAWRHLSEIASHGYLVIAPGKMLSGPGIPEKPMEERAPPVLTEDGKLPGPVTTSKQMQSAIDWALEQNKRSNSPYYNRIDENAIAAAGTSCGGLQVIEIADDPRLKTVIIQNSGVFKDGVQRIAGINVVKSMLRNFHTPVAYIEGGPEDQATENGEDDFRQIEHVPVTFMSLPVGHGGTFDQPNGGAVASVALDWLEWQLRGDASAARTFQGENCRLCNGTQWSIQRKNWHNGQ